MRTIRIGDRWVGEGHPPYFVADIAANHDGSLERAFRLIDLAAEAGAHAAKFQNFRAPAIVSRRGFEALGGQRGHQAGWRKPVFDTYQDASLPPDWTAKLRDRCERAGVEYFTSPYDLASVDHVDPFVRVYKIGSGDIDWPEILAHIAAKGKPVMLATGASTLEDVRRAMAVLQARTADIVLMQCNTCYTGSPDEYDHINLRVLPAYAAEFPDAVLGLSDHTPGHVTVLGALALGAHVFEKHFTDDNSRPGPDHGFAMNPRTWREMVDRAGELHRALGDGVKRVQDNERETAMLQRRCLRYTASLARGTRLQREHLVALRPAAPGGFAPHRIDEVVGAVLARDVAEEDPVRAEDLLR